MTLDQFKAYVTDLQARLQRGEVLTKQEMGPVLRLIPQDSHRAFFDCPEWRAFSKVAIKQIEAVGWDGTMIRGDLK